MKQHNIAVHEGKKPYECPSCNRSFSEKKSLNKHILSVHKGQKPYDCQICNARFSEDSKLRRHVKSIHEGNNSYECESCNSCFSKIGNLKNHIARFHGEKQASCISFASKNSIDKESVIRNIWIYDKKYWIFKAYRKKPNL